MSLRSSHSSDPLLANEQVGAAGFHELASGIDALYLSGRSHPSGELLERLEGAKREAQESEEAVAFSLGDVEFRLSPYSWGKYTYSLEHRYGRLGVRKSGRIPPVRVQARAEALHGESPSAVFELFDEVVRTGIGPVVWMVSRIDLYVDVQGWALSLGMAERFVSRSTKRTVYTEGELCTGFQFGTRKSKAISARIYDKTVDMANKGTDWIKDSWGDRYDPARPVHRVEFELGRNAVKQFQVSEPVEVFEAVPDLWRYCTTDWLRLCEATDDGNRSRWPTDPTWKTVENASLRQQELGLSRIKAKKGAAALVRIVPQLIGYLVSFAALVGAATVDDALRLLPRHLARYEKHTGISFADRVARRRREARFR